MDERVPFLRAVALRRDDLPRGYPFDIPAIAHLDRLDLDQPLTVFVGENGAGKSTLIEAIAILAGLNPEGGTKNFSFSDRETESELHERMFLVRSHKRERHALFLRAETAFNIATRGERYGGRWSGLHAMSHGEAFLEMLQNQLSPPGLLILDEPEAGLSPQRQLMTLRLLHDQLRGGTQIIMATHSPILLSHPEAVIYALSAEGISKTSFRETEHYTLMRSFLERPESFLRYLLED